MSISDTSAVIVQLILYCMPAAFLINLSGYACQVVLSAATGKGLKL